MIHFSFDLSSIISFWSQGMKVKELEFFVSSSISFTSGKMLSKSPESKHVVGGIVKNIPQAQIYCVLFGSFHLNATVGPH